MPIIQKYIINERLFEKSPYCSNIFEYLLYQKSKCIPCESCGFLDRCFCPTRSRDARDCGCQFALLHRADTETSQRLEEHTSQSQKRQMFASKTNRSYRLSEQECCVSVENPTIKILSMILVNKITEQNMQIVEQLPRI